jgi:maleate isomerase
MDGWRARVGYIVPSSGTTTQAEWDSVRPEGVLFVCSRVRLESVAFDSIASAASELKRAAAELATADINSLIQVGTPFALAPKTGGPDEIEELLQKTSGVPSMSMAAASVLALKQLQVRRIAVAAPYIPEIRVQLEAFLTQSGFEVLACESLGIVSNLEINRLPTHIAYQTAKKALANAAGAEAIFIASGGWHTFGILEALESDTGIPAVSSNAAGLWAGLGLAGVQESIPGHGRLLRQMGHQSLRTSARMRSNASVHTNQTV